MNNIEMDNQQESSKLIRYGWFAGIMDGEGTITIRKRNRKNSSDILLTPTITMVNTDKTLIDEFVSILKEWEVPYWITFYKGTVNWKASWKVEITGIRRCSRTMPFFKDYLINKKELANLVLDWCTYRIKNLGNRSNYTEYDLEVYKKIKALHGHKVVLKSSETICGTSYKEEDEEIVRTA